MKSDGRGYTILEVMLFLVITSALFLSAYYMMQGQQTRAQFSQGMRDVESKLRDYINDVSTGYYPQVGEFSCNAGPTTISFADASGGGDTTGTNLSCIFLGKALQVQPSDGNDILYAHSVVGRRTVGVAGGSRDVTSYAEATPTAVYDDSIGLDKTERYEIPWGVRVKSTSVAGNNGRMLAIYSSLSRTSSVTPGQNESGALVLQPIIYNVSTGETKENAIACINTSATCGQLNATFDEWALCFERSDGNETAVITIGGDGKKTNLTLEFKDC